MAYNLNIDRFGNEQQNGVVGHAVYAHSPNVASIPNNTQTNVTAYGTTVVNTVGGSWNATTGVFTCTRAGNYQVYGHLEWFSGSWVIGNSFTTQLLKNGAVFAASRDIIQAAHTSVHQSLPTSGIVTLAVGDTVRMSSIQVTGATRALTASVFTSFHIHEI
jgi:hypothetical protein